MWVDLIGPDRDRLEEISRILQLHPLIAEDIAEQNQRPRLRIADDVAHIVLFALSHEGEVRAQEIDIVLGRGFLLTAHDEGWDPDSASGLRAGVETVLARGPDYLLWVIADAIVDAYFPVFDKLADEIDELQDDVITNATPWTLHRLFVLKRELLEVRRATSPARDVFNQLTNRDTRFVGSDHVIYFRDVYDHLIRVTDELDNYRELVSGTLEVYLSTVNNGLSLIMKRLTGVTVILAGIGAIAGIFGMSEAASAVTGAEAGGFWMVTGGLVALAIVAVVVLRRIDWI
jgi:magnesium transporter